MSKITEIQIPLNLHLQKIKYYIKYYSSSALITENSIITYKNNSNYDSSFNCPISSIENSFSDIQINHIKKIVSNDNVMHMITNEGLLYSIGKDYNNFGILGMGNLVQKIYISMISMT